MYAQLDVILSVDWEGLSLSPENLDALVEFKKKYQVPIVHYFNPGYFTSPGSQRIHAKLLDVFKNDDEIALHLHGAKHFVEASGVPFKSSPSFSCYGDQHSGDFFGQEVMLHSYCKKDFIKLVEHSIRLFKEYGLGVPKSFRAGGWMLSPEQMDALSELGFSYDSSSVPGDFFVGRAWQGDNLHRYAQVLWSDIKAESQPYYHSSELLEVPNNLGAIDYWRDHEIKGFVDQSLEISRSQGYHCAVVTGHQETSFEHFHKLEKYVETLARVSDGVDIQFVTNQTLRKNGFFMNSLHSAGRESFNFSNKTYFSDSNV